MFNTQCDITVVCYSSYVFMYSMLLCSCNQSCTNELYECRVYNTMTMLLQHMVNNSLTMNYGLRMADLKFPETVKHPDSLVSTICMPL